MKLRIAPLLLVLILLLTFFAGCGGGASAPETAEESAASDYKELTIYTAITEYEISTYLEAFEKDTGIRINYVRLSSGEMLNRMIEEKDNPQASVMYASSSDNFIAANKEGLLTPYQPADMSGIPSQYIDADGVWSPIYASAIAFACNPKWFKENDLPYPTSWQDLIRPEFKGQISMAHPSTSGTSYTVLATLVQLLGEDKTWDYLTLLNENVSQYTKAGSVAPLEAALGEAAIALTFTHDGLKAAGEGYPIVLSFPSEGTGYEIGAVALIKNGFEKEQENAKIFIDWCTGARAQELYIDTASNRIPINAKAKLSDGLLRLDQVNVIDYDAVWAGNNKKRLVEEFLAKIDNADNLKE